MVVTVGIKSHFPSHIKVISVPDTLYSLKAKTFAKLLEVEIGG